MHYKSSPLRTAVTYFISHRLVKVLVFGYSLYVRAKDWFKVRLRVPSPLTPSYYQTASTTLAT